MPIRKTGQTTGSFLPFLFTSQDLSSVLPTCSWQFQSQVLQCQECRLLPADSVFCWGRSMGHLVDTLGSTQKMPSHEFQWETPLKYDTLILAQCPFFVWVCLSASKINVAAGNASHSSIHPFLENHVNRSVSFEFSGCTLQTSGLLDKSSQRAHSSPLSDRPNQEVFHCKQLFS